jgi:hypothetical protein
MHKTLHTNVKGYIDNNVIFDKEIIIRGWCFHTEKGILPLQAKTADNIINIISQRREDVGRFYKRNDIDNCGWTFRYPRHLSSELQINIDNEWQTIFIFNPNIKDESSINVIEENINIVSDIDTSSLVDARTNSNILPSFLVVDNFYKNPDSVRQFALKQDFQYNKEYHKGKRTNRVFRFPELKESFETILGYKIKNWDKYGVNGVFQVCYAGDQLVYHVDTQQYAAVLFLTPDAPPGTGTSFYRSKYTKKIKIDNGEHSLVFKNGYLDSTDFELVDTVGNVYNRIVFFDAQQIHAATNYFGNNNQNCRLFQIFFFDLDI